MRTHILLSFCLGWMTHIACLMHVEQTVYMCTKGKLGKLLVTIRGPLIGVLCGKLNYALTHYKREYECKAFQMQVHFIHEMQWLRKSLASIYWVSEQVKRYICLWILTEHTFYYVTQKNLMLKIEWSMKGFVVYTVLQNIMVFSWTNSIILLGQWFLHVHILLVVHTHKKLQFI